jgi:hypothetical protein
MGMRQPVALARELALLGADVVVVGSTARLLRGFRVDPADLDVAVRDDALPSLVHALAALGSPVDAGRLARGRCVRVSTAWGPLDVFVGPVPHGPQVDVDGVRVGVAA